MNIRAHGQRASGILLPISSLPSPYGIGALGEEAYRFADFLKQAGQSWWQVLPLGPTSFGDSPYQVLSTYAGNPNFIDLQQLINDGLLRSWEVEAVDWYYTPRFVEYAKLHRHRAGLLQLAAERGKDKYKKEFAIFCEEQAHWLNEYALFAALKRHFHMAAFLNWHDANCIYRQPATLESYRQQLKVKIHTEQFVQFLFFRQFHAFRAYLQAQGIHLLGDLPIYDALDSADVWEHPHSYQLDEHLLPLAVAGVPPDYFSSSGQLWGNPLYDWDALKKEEYRYWLDRFAHTASMFDGIRIDHFRGLGAYWSIPAGAATAAEGCWKKGPGQELVNRLQALFPEHLLIAEDLGDPAEGLQEFVAQSGMPGMKVLQFAFNHAENSMHLPHWYTPDCVCYTGTHDNTTASGWYSTLGEQDAAFARTYLQYSEEEGAVWGLIRCGMSSKAALFIAQMQDYLELSDAYRMNTPGTMGNNWRWRLLPGEANTALAERIATLTGKYRRV